MKIDLRPLSEKINESLSIIQQWSELSKSKWDGYTVAFSGGKDSQVVYTLAKMAGVKFKAVYNVTTIDHPENVYFIRKNYPDVVFDFPKQTFFQLVNKKGFLPEIGKRWCCEILKERGGRGFFLDGVRAEESLRRSKYEVIHFKKGMKFEVGKIKVNRKIIVHPILKWNEADVWEFIERENLPINKLYETKNRVGCMFCPFAPTKELMKIKTECPGYYKLMLKAIENLMNKGYGKKFTWKDAEELYDWWCSKEKMQVFYLKKRQLCLF